MIYEQQKTKIHSTIFIITLVLSLVFAGDYKTVDAEKVNKVETGTGLSSFTGNTTLSKTKDDRKQIIPKEKLGALLHESNAQCDKECKINTLTGIGIDEKLARPLVENCKRFALNPRHCIIAGASIMTAESGGKLENCNHKNCMGLGGGGFWYDTYEAGVIDWITRYSRFWYKAKSATFFYPAKGEKSKSRYCTSELSSGSEVGCPFGLSHASSTWKKLDSIF